MMVNPRLRENTLICVTLFFACLLTLLPLPEWAVFARPQWILITLLFWFIHLPRKVGPGIAFLMGVYADILTGSTIGQHAFVFVGLCYVVLRFVRMIQAMPMWQQLVGVFCVTMLNLTVQALIMRIHTPMSLGWMYWLPMLSNCMIWPWLYWLLRDFRPKTEFKVVY